MPELLICLPPLSPEAQQPALDVVAQALPGDSVAVALADTGGDKPTAGRLSYTDPRMQTGWSLAAADYLAAANLARTHEAKYVLLLGSETLSTQLLTGLASGLMSNSADVVVPRLHPGPREGLVTAGLLYPLTSALYGQDVRFPLPYNVGLSSRGMDRLGAVARREVSAGKSESLLWPVSAAAKAGLAVREAETGEHTLPTPLVADFNQLFTEVISSLFLDVEEQAILWQRARSGSLAERAALPTASPDQCATEDSDLAATAHRVEEFRAAYANLLPIWSLVLPPQTLLALKKLSRMDEASFRFPAALWARVVYDFALAFHLRTLSRSHAVGALTPLYLAWAASYLRCVADNPAMAEDRVQEQALAFKQERPYFISRWRWPDRFNP